MVRSHWCVASRRSRDCQALFAKPQIAVETSTSHSIFSRVLGCIRRCKLTQTLPLWAVSGTSQSGTGPSTPNTPQTSTSGGSVAGKQVTNNFFYLPTPFGPSAGGAAGVCTVIGTSNSPPLNSVGVSDNQAFFRTLEHTSACGDNANWKIRIGTGGQVGNWAAPCDILCVCFFLCSVGNQVQVCFST